MQLNHLNLTVTDVREAQQFLAKYFGMEDAGGNANMALLRDGHGMMLTLTSMKVGRETEVKYPATFHIGFGQESEEQVNSLYARLVADGVEPPAPSKQHGSWGFYFKAPGGFVIEVLS
jgi:lactoylglutathione lyase